MLLVFHPNKVLSARLNQLSRSISLGREASTGRLRAELGSGELDESESGMTG